MMRTAGALGLILATIFGLLALTQFAAARPVAALFIKAGVEVRAWARVAFLKRFEPQDPSLSPEERQQQAQAALRAHMSELEECR